MKKHEEKSNLNDRMARKTKSNENDIAGINNIEKRRKIKERVR